MIPGSLLIISVKWAFVPLLSRYIFCTLEAIIILLQQISHFSLVHRRLLFPHCCQSLLLLCITPSDYVVPSQVNLNSPDATYHKFFISIRTSCKALHGHLKYFNYCKKREQSKGQFFIGCEVHFCTSLQSCNESQIFTKSFTVEWGMLDLTNNPSKSSLLTYQLLWFLCNHSFQRSKKNMELHRKFCQHEI